uniref:Uncharacterized protein n=1 Tax=Strigamia maritima TaxID=126957 RepID=T1IRY5_STRMM
MVMSLRIPYVLRNIYVDDCKPGFIYTLLLLFGAKYAAPHDPRECSDFNYQYTLPSNVKSALSLGIRKSEN